MIRGNSIVRLRCLSLACCSLVGIALVGAAMAQSGDGRPTSTRPDRSQLPQPVYRVAQQLADASIPNPQAANPAGQPPAQVEHPLDPALRIAYSALDNAQKNIKDYTATMIKRERIGGRLNDNEYMFIKVRHQPFSVYTYFLAPDKLKGQEAIYVQGKNEGNVVAHGVGLKAAIGTVRLKPDSALMMAGQRYPITEIGVLNLTKRLVEVAEKDRKRGEVEVKFFKGAMVNKRSCTRIMVVHPVQRPYFQFNVANVYVDDELNIPVRYEAYDWPTTPGGKPQLLEEYTYIDVKLNVGLTDGDFDERNPKYGYRN